VNKAFSWLNSTPLYRVPPVHHKWGINKNGRRDSSGLYCQQCNRNAVTFRYVHAWLPKCSGKTSALTNNVQWRRKKSFSETSRLLFSSLEHKIVHDKDIMILEFNAFLENVTMLLSECFRVRVFLFTYISAKCNYGFQKRKQQLGYSM